ncbi:MAG: hypothetical protein FGM42_01000 [Ilumatobacteraceae bacterium]|nr:hypothetical protein [Ilumatobacteraceae bacterium]
MRRIGILLLGGAVLFTSFVGASGAEADPCDFDSATMLPVSLRAASLEITGRDITRTEMARLWEITTTRSDAYLLLGKVIGEGQNWFGACQFPGLGLVTGSGGGDLSRRYVALWVWADGVDFEAARRSVIAFVSDEIVVTTVPESTTTSTTTTTLSFPSVQSPVTPPLTTSMPDHVAVAPSSTTTSSSTVADPYEVLTTVTSPSTSTSPVTSITHPDLTSPPAVVFGPSTTMTKSPSSAPAAPSIVPAEISTSTGYSATTVQAPQPRQESVEVATTPPPAVVGSVIKVMDRTKPKTQRSKAKSARTSRVDPVRVSRQAVR